MWPLLYPNEKFRWFPILVAGSSSSQAVKPDPSKAKLIRDSSSQDVRPNRNAQITRSNSIREQGDRLVTRRISQSITSDILPKKSLLENAQRKPSTLKAIKIEPPARKNSVSSIPKAEPTKLSITAPVEKPNSDDDYEYEDDFEVSFYPP